MTTLPLVTGLTHHIIQGYERGDCKIEATKNKQHLHGEMNDTEICKLAY